MRLAIALLLVASSAALAQPAPESPDEPPTPPPGGGDDAPVDAPIPTDGTDGDNVPPIPVVPQPEPPEPPGPPPKPREPPTQLDDTTSVRFDHHHHVDLHWTILMLPERALELAFLPVGLLVGAIDQYRLDRRIGDLLSVENIKVKLSPRFKFSLGDGAGIGLWVKREIVDWRASLRAGGIIRLDSDWQTELEYNHALLFPGGRGLRARAFIERDKNQRFYGIGGDSQVTDERVIEVFEQGALAEIDLQGIDHYTTSGIAQLGMRRQRLSTGKSATSTPLMTGDTVAPPPAFDDIATYVDARLVGRYDTRDTAGRPSRGLTLEGSVLGRADVTGKQLSATTLGASARYFIPLLPDHRVLVLTVAGAAALPLIPGDDKPLDSLATIDRTNVRGYDRERFRDLYAIVASAEYRFPIYEYLASRIGLDAFTFVDAGTIWGNDPFSLKPLRYAIGGGLRGASEPSLYFQTTLGWSPEGFQFNIGVESAL
jgi:hypothetical protein